MSRPRCVVLVSGGMDSCVTAAVAAGEHQPSFLHVSYGQRTEARERQAFDRIADHYGVKERLVIRLDALERIGGSCLTDRSIPVPEAKPARTGIPVSYVPFRNAHLLAAAVSWGEILDARAIFIGAVEEDSSGYPDCRRIFYDAWNRVIEAGTRPETSLHVETPLIAMRKSEIVRLGLDLNAPLHLTWSCYRSGDLACGRCDSCALRLRGFREAGAVDPIRYEEPPSGQPDRAGRAGESGRE